MMKRFLFLALAGIVSWMANTSVATAGLIAPGDTTTSIGATDAALELTTPAVVSGVILKDTGALPYSFGGGVNTGTVQEIIVADASNPLGAGKLTFLFQVHVATGDISRLSNSNYAAGVLTDVAMSPALFPFDPTGTHGALTADRGLSAVGFNFGPPVASDIIPGGTAATSVALIIRTNASFFVPGFIGLIDGGSAEIAGYAPTLTPEPASVVLLGFGAAGMLGYGWKRRKVTA